jgi:hypothetical protein
VRGTGAQFQLASQSVNFGFKSGFSGRTSPLRPDEAMNKHVAFLWSPPAPWTASDDSRLKNPREGTFVITPVHVFEVNFLCLFHSFLSDRTALQTPGELRCDRCRIPDPRNQIVGTSRPRRCIWSWTTDQDGEVHLNGTKCLGCSSGKSGLKCDGMGSTLLPLVAPWSTGMLSLALIFRFV